ncbi:hypothetical protein [Candidatus Tisiphia endosymbiont of Oplodontha viridula]|uniref:hypothetical protein n=1 Tax=Candidatus Tisiphia endosymbiont of Oplodontha viridula TaxID=3077925 RepID=UPI0035C9033A
MDNTIQLLLLSVIGIIIVVILLIMISIKWLYNIWFNINHVAKRSEDFPHTFTNDIEEVKLLRQKLKELINITAKEEEKILQSVFFSEEIKICINMLLIEIREFKEQNQLSKKQEASSNDNN